MLKVLHQKIVFKFNWHDKIKISNTLVESNLPLSYIIDY